jgi:hypothetical protein
MRIRVSFNCHHFGCEFHGGLGALRKRLGIRREWLPRDEYRSQRTEGARAHEAALRLHVAVHVRRMELLDQLHDLAWLENAAHEAGPDDPETWADLDLVYRERPRLEEKLDRLEQGGVGEIVALLREESV